MTVNHRQWKLVCAPSVRRQRNVRYEPMYYIHYKDDRKSVWRRGGERFVKAFGGEECDGLGGNSYDILEGPFCASFAVT